MKKQGFDRRDFLKTAVVSGAAAAGGTATIVTPDIAQAAQPAPAAPPAAEAAGPAGYSYLNLDEAAFVEALLGHMIPADEISPKGTDLSVNVYIDRALAGAWAKGEHLYMQGPKEARQPEPGCQTASQFYRADIRQLFLLETTIDCARLSRGSSGGSIGPLEDRDIASRMADGSAIYLRG